MLHLTVKQLFLVAITLHAHSSDLTCLLTQGVIVALERVGIPLKSIEVNSYVKLYYFLF